MYKKLTIEEVLMKIKKGKKIDSSFFFNQDLDYNVREHLFKLSVNKLAKQDLLKIVSFDSYMIMYIDKPSQDLQMAAVDDCPLMIKYINNPSKKTVLYCLEKGERQAVKFVEEKFYKDKEVIVCMIINVNSYYWSKTAINKYINNDIDKAIDLIKYDTAIIEFLPSEIIQSQEFEEWFANKYKKLNYHRFSKAFPYFSIKLKRLMAEVWNDYEFSYLNTDDDLAIKTAIMHNPDSIDFLSDSRSKSCLGRELKEDEIELIFKHTKKKIVPKDVEVTEDFKKYMLKYWSLTDAIQYLDWIQPDTEMADLAKKYSKEILIMG